MPLRVVALFCCAAFVLLGETYKGPVPARPDVPYLALADNLVSTEATEAKQEERKGQVLYYVPGASSSARTPLASPIFLFQSENISPEQLQLYKFEVKNGRREVLISKKKRQTARAIGFSSHRIAEGLYRLETDGALDNGEYALSPAESNQVFCFEVY